MTVPTNVQGLRTHNDDESIHPGNDKVRVFGRAYVTVTTGLAPGTYDVYGVCDWNIGGFYGIDDYRGGNNDSATLVITDSAGSQPPTPPPPQGENGRVTVIFEGKTPPGARWSIQGRSGSYLSGSTVQLADGTYTLLFDYDRPYDYTQWTIPDPCPVTVSKGDNWTAKVSFECGCGPTPTSGGTIRVTITPSGVVGGEWTYDGWGHVLQSGQTAKVAAGTYTLTFRCGASTPPYFPPDPEAVFVPEGGAVNGTARFTQSDPRLEDAWKIRRERTTTLSLADASGQIQCETETKVDKDGVATSVTRTVPQSHVEGLFEVPKVLLPQERRGVHKALAAADGQSVGWFGLRQKTVRLTGIHEDEQHDALADYWLERAADCIKATLEIPLNPAIRARDQVTHQGRTYRIERIRHRLSDRTTELTMWRRPTVGELSEALHGEATDLGKEVVAAIRAAGRRLDNVRIGVVLDQADWRTFDVRLHGTTEVVRAANDRVEGLLPGSLVLVAKTTEVF